MAATLPDSICAFPQSHAHMTTALVEGHRAPPLRPCSRSDGRSVSRAARAEPRERLVAARINTFAKTPAPPRAPAAADDSVQHADIELSWRDLVERDGYGRLGCGR